ncbi:7-dehydrocholesterol reductase [Citrus sinensis]|nr:7-dehydrocholesterol reductase [Citrus sinensis]
MAAATESKTVHSAAVTYVSMISLLTLCPPFVILLWYTMVHADGSVIKSWDYLRQNGLQGFIDIWPRPTAVAWKLIACFGAFEAALQLLLPGKRVEGPISPTGHRPVYKANGVAAYAVTLITYLSLWWFGIFNPTIVYDHLGEIYSALIFGSFIFCIFLYIKGMELYPRIGKNFDIKVFTNCRFGMMSWAVLAVTYCIKQYEANAKVEDSMLVNTILMLIYVTKFFLWEAGYWSTMDIAHDRAGFYICWGCLVWVPSVYTSPGMYLVNHPVHLGTQIVASYTTSSGETKQSLLLTSGCFYHTSTLYFLRSFFSTELKETMIDVDPNTGNTGKYTARRFPTGSFLESTETFINVESLTVAHFKFLGLFISDGYVRKMSAYDNVVGGKLKLKGKALDVKAGGMKKKKKHKKNHDQIAQVIEDDLSAGGSTEVLADPDEKETNDATKEIGEEKPAPYDDNLTPAERRYIEQRQKLDVNRLAKEANKSHRDRIQDFNQYLANMSEHYDIPKVGPG